jgi:hypothetical protein
MLGMPFVEAKTIYLSIMLQPHQSLEFHLIILALITTKEDLPFSIARFTYRIQITSCPLKALDLRLA